MPGNAVGGKKAAAKNLANDPDFYKRIGKLGGSVRSDKPRGFAVNRDLARTAGAKGGRISRKNKVA